MGKNIGVITFGKELHIYFSKDAIIDDKSFDEDSAFEEISKAISEKSSLFTFYNGQRNYYINPRDILYIKQYLKSEI